MDTAELFGSVKAGIAAIIAFLPLLLGAILVLVLGWIVARLVSKLVIKALIALRVDAALDKSSVGIWLRKYLPKMSLARTVGAITFWFLFLGAVSLAVATLGIRPLTDLVGMIFAYLPNVFVALLILIAAAVISSAVAGLIDRFAGATGTGRVAKVALPILILSIATFMALNQLKIAEEIVTITYAALIGALALGSAIAFGLGGKDAAARLLDSAIQKGQQVAPAVRHDVRQAMRRAEEESRQNGGRSANR